MTACGTFLGRCQAPFLWLYAQFIRWCIWEAESHIKDCAADGLSDSMSLREFRRQIEADRVRLDMVHERLRTARDPGSRLPVPREPVDSAAANVEGRRHYRKGA